MARWIVVSLVAVNAMACATGIRFVPGPTPPARNLIDVQLAQGVMCSVTLSSGETIRGRFESLGPDALVLAIGQPDGTREMRVIREADIVRIGRFVGRSPAANGLLGAGVGAAVSIPVAYALNLFLGWSMRWPDLLAPGAVAGGIAGGSRPQKAEIIFEKMPQSRY
jgi:hypothetical protein